MKAYVNYFDTDGARARANLKQDDIRDDETVVQFSPNPNEWKMSRGEAEANCAMLNRATIRAKNNPLHLCYFEAEEVGPEEFSIFCGDHPHFNLA